MFVGEIPRDVLDIETPEPFQKPPKQKRSFRRKMEFEDYSQEFPDYDENSLYHVGTYIRHPKFGRGKITACSGTGDDTIVTILFGTREIKIMAKYGKLVPA